MTKVENKQEQKKLWKLLVSAYRKYGYSAGKARYFARQALQR